MDRTPGQTIGQYPVVQKIGEGGTGAVYKAEQPSIPPAVVIKDLATSFAEHPEARERARRDLEKTTLLEQPPILPVYDYGEVNGSPTIVMRFMTEGGTLHERLHSAGFRCAEAVRLLHSGLDVPQRRALGDSRAFSRRRDSRPASGCI